MTATSPNTLGHALRGFFADHLPRVRGASPHTVRSYRDTFVLLLRFVANISREGCVVEMQRIGRETPVGRLAGPDNILVFQTQRYFENPLVIQGPGAGAGVTAAGVLSDILKIAKSI